MILLINNENIEFICKSLTYVEIFARKSLVIFDYYKIDNYIIFRLNLQIIHMLSKDYLF